MFLNYLSELEKKNYLDLALAAAHCDGAIPEAEANLIEQYKVEMHLEYEPVLRPVDEILAAFSVASENTKKIIFFELLGLMFADNVYNENETHFMSQIAAAFNINSEFIGKSKKLLADYLSVYKEIIKLIRE